VRADRYILSLSGPDVTPRALALDVPAADFNVGKVALTRRGRIEGRVFRSPRRGGDLWALADGRIRCPDLRGAEEIEFKSDADGRFSVAGVPAGLVKIGFPYATFDVIYADEWTAQVLPGQTTQVHLFDAENNHPFAVDVHIGDGSKAAYNSGSGFGTSRTVENVTMLDRLFARFAFSKPAPRVYVDLIPRPGQPLSFVDPDWMKLEATGRLVLTDVSPGDYKMHVLDWQGLRDFTDGVLFERDITIAADSTSTQVPLGAGCITGRFLGAGEYLNRIEVVAVTAERRGLPRRSHCDMAGNFCLRYLDAGRYTLFAHYPKVGWSRADNIVVAANAVDAGEHRLVPGGSIVGSIWFPRPGLVPSEIIATGPAGAVLQVPFAVYSSFDQFELDGLWPGKWNIAVRSRGELLSTASAQIMATETVRLGFVVGK
jgi:hypothetical protein